MNEQLSYVFLGILTGWLIYLMTGLLVGPVIAALLGAMLCILTDTRLRDHVVIQSLMGLLDPIGIVLPVLALSHVALGLGVPVPIFSTVELLIFLLAYLAFLASAMGLLPVDPYRLGYAPLPVGGMVLAACLYGMLMGNWLLPFIAVAGQGLWVMRWGSSNWFDHVLHAALVPVVLVSLLARVF